jgi:hypothetical protein
MARAARFSGVAEEVVMTDPRRRYTENRTPERVHESDFFSTPVPKVLIALIMVVLLGLAIWLVIGSWGVEYGTPPSDTYSVPPPVPD